MLDEFKLLQSCVKPTYGQGVVIGPGDDCSVIDYSKSHYQISTMDSLIEGTHFIKNQISMEQLAFKALTVNISDIAAMGGRPLWCHLGLVLPKDFTTKEAKVFFKSFNKMAKKHKIALIGGNTCSTGSNLSVHIHLSGLVEKEKIQLRSDFKKSEYLCVTKSLGDSAAGLNILSQQSKTKKAKHLSLVEKKLRNSHFTPSIEIEKACWLASQKSVHGMMDLSDGLLSDLRHVPNVDLKIHLEKIPLSKELKSYCKKMNLDPFEFAIAGGEDYAIIFGCEKKNIIKLQKKYNQQFSSDFFVIGEISYGAKKTTWLKNSKLTRIKYKYFKHF